MTEFIPESTNSNAAVAGSEEAWPGRNAELDAGRVRTLATLGLMLSVMAGGNAPEVTGFDASKLYAEVLMALAIEDSDNPDIALEEARDHPEDHTLLAAAPQAPGEVDRLRMFLEILAAAGGEQDATDSKWNWVNAFCSEHEGREPDTFNFANQRGFTSVSHDTDSDTGVVRITAAGRAYLAAAPTPQRPVAAQSTVAFVQEWMMSGDHDPDQWHRDFAAAIDARCTPQRADAEDVERLIEWARSEMAFPEGNPGGSGRGHIDENHRFKLRDLVAAIDAGAPQFPEVGDKGDATADVEPWQHLDARELGLLYNHKADDSAQFTRWQMMAAIAHGRRLAASPPASTDNRIFDLLEGLSGALLRNGDRRGFKMKSAYARGTGGVDVEYLVSLLSTPQRADAEDVERVAQAMWESEDEPGTLDDSGRRGTFERLAHYALAAMPRASQQEPLGPYATTIANGNGYPVKVLLASYAYIVQGDQQITLERDAARALAAVLAPSQQAGRTEREAVEEAAMADALLAKPYLSDEDKRRVRALRAAVCTQPAREGREG
jgi:hypothetical protein